MRKLFRGFTLIELLIVIAVIGILAAGLLILINPVTQLQRSRDAGRKTALKSIQNALEQYFSDNGVYPSTNCWSSNTSTCWSVGNGVSNLLGTNATNYIKSMPQDPTFKDNGDACGASNVSANTLSRGYAYYTPDSGKTYILVTKIENSLDLSIQATASNYFNGTGGCTAFGNYKLVSQQQ